jgi:hypothetical protein
VRDAGLRFQPHVGQDFGDAGRSPELAIAQFRILVEPPAPFDDLRLHLGGGGVDPLIVDICLRRGAVRRHDDANDPHSVHLTLQSI